MITPLRIRGIVLVWACLGIGAGGAGRAFAEEAPAPSGKPRLADYFGFLPLEIYKLEYRISNLTLADVDGDKVDDVIVADNARSRIDLLLSSQKPAGAADSRPFRKEVNDLESDKRMRSANLPVDREIVSLGAGDFNGDGKPDLIFYGSPAEIVILHNEGAGKFGPPRRIKCGDAVEAPNALAVGDFDQDGRDDVALLAEGELVLIRQPEPGVLSEPERVPHTATNPRMVKIHDLDGDGAADLVIMDGDPEHPIHVRFATADKKLGPERRFALATPRALAFGQIDGKGGVELLTVEEQSGRGKVYTLDESAPDSDDRWGRLVFFGFPRGNERGRSLAVGDLDGDKRKDVVVTDPANAQVWVYRQAGEAGLSTGESFPGLLGGKGTVLADLDGDGRDEVYVLSEQEKQIGRSRFEENRLTFPAALPIKGEPVAMALADVDESGKPALVYAARSKPGADSFELRAIRADGPGGFAEVKFGATESAPLAGLSGAPTAIQAFDVNHDGETDFLVFSAFGSPILLLGQKDEALKPFTGGLGPLGGATPAALTVADLDGPALMVAQNTFARRVQLDDQGQWQIKDQFNAARGTAQIQGAAALDLDGEGRKDVVLLDRSTKSLLFLTPKDGVYRQAGSLSVGAVNFDGLHVGDFDGDGRDDLLIAGTDRFAVLQTGGRGRRLKVIASYEPRTVEGRLGDLIAGDFNADGVADVIFTDVAEQALDVATFDGGEDLLHALTFKLYERKSFRGGGASFEPREMAAGDVDGDGRTDLVVILHDRVVILRQDPGPDEKKPPETAAAPQ
ncbi:FG-GAP repeat domain-containing protein [Planctomyces sp. SH-PL62]|uniref:FG-GAP repeat domain-containing protein n=1 Tax=Planctomyces sp. SH-PL62 TaxID=1636152 RepID=UPI00078BCB63|nr:VCBS repeat-containing protein [Planctomyces sp. SH-PL62]AMV38186.1 FG-GAP repeat protein [Planctomyces sp. SH-PL62]